MAELFWMLYIVFLIGLSFMIIGRAIQNHTFPKGIFEWLTFIVTIIAVWFYYNYVI